jgi:hypothetical protein
MRLSTVLLPSFVLAGALATAFAQATAPADKANSPVASMPGGAGMMASEARAQELMTTMQAQMNKLRETADPEQRQKLMQEHTATMQQAMKSMRTHGQTMGMMGGGMMGGGMMGGGPAGGQPGEARGSPDEQPRMREQCMEMMHQIMQHEGMMERN